MASLPEQQEFCIDHRGHYFYVLHYLISFPYLGYSGTLGSVGWEQQILGEKILVNQQSIQSYLVLSLISHVDTCRQQKFRAEKA